MPSYYIYNTGPLLDSNSYLFKLELVRSKDKQILMTTMMDALSTILPSTNFLKTDVSTNVGFVIGKFDFRFWFYCDMGFFCINNFFKENLFCSLTLEITAGSKCFLIREVFLYFFNNFFLIVGEKQEYLHNISFTCYLQFLFRLKIIIVTRNIHPIPNGIFLM